jgi:hypothetical protein
VSHTDDSTGKRHRALLDVPWMTPSSETYVSYSSSSAADAALTPPAEDAEGAPRPRRALRQETPTVVPRTGVTDAEALVTGFTAYDVDTLIANKLLTNNNGSSTSRLYDAQFSGICTSLCRVPGASKASLDAGRRTLELCDNCWCAPALHAG